MNLNILLQKEKGFKKINIINVKYKVQSTMKYLFSIEGNIGSGKSTLVDIILKKSNYILLQEPVEEWNNIVDTNGETILQKLYTDPSKYSFSFQMMAYISRLKLLKETIKNAPDNSVIITERCLFTDREIFAKMLYDSGNINEIEMQIYNKWFEYFNEIKVDGIIYLKVPAEECGIRIKSRNRKGEETIPLSYLRDCEDYHERWIQSTDIPVLQIDSPIIETGLVIETGPVIETGSWYSTITDFISLKTLEK